MQLNDLILYIFNMFILMIGVLVGVAFLTLLERKVLGYIQFRKGPNKLGINGIIQPFSDAIKLFSKEYYLPLKSNFLFFLFCPIFSLGLSLMVWLLMPYLEGLGFLSLGFLMFLCFLSLGVYMIMMAGWSSNSNYALLGSLRAIVQTISYEVSLIFLFLCVILLIMDFNLVNLISYQKNIMFFFLMMPIALSIFSSMLAECNRTPFDFSEGESELVSGFNIEYGGSEFALIFLAEYSMILFMSLIYVLFFLSFKSLGVVFFLKVVMVGFGFIWVRGTLPRFRYDKLMYLTWKIYLPFSLNYFLFLCCLFML
uniref:NADH dehydrogenase subunit 1 n=1 Tax=Hydromanicus huapingensis TaxID=1875469 RepID=UPI002237D55D|nr:NADH dehydrogenase subunit 1 [Hydromanicus huapingensis]UYO79252.1 NADH dehydrogenase subunit 1 [Hydromanicus huapingensis]